MQGLTNLGNSIMGLGQSMYSTQRNEQAQARADEQAIAVGTFRNQFNLQSRAIRDEINNLVRNFNSHQEMQAFDIGGHIATHRDNISGLLEQFAHDPVLQDKMRVELDANWFNFENQLHEFTRGSYKAMVDRELEGNFSQAAAAGDLQSIAEYEHTLLGAFELDSPNEIAQLEQLEAMLRQQDIFINNNPNDENIENVRNERASILSQIEEIENYLSEKNQGQLLYNPHQVRQIADAYRKEAAGVQLQQSVFDMTPSSARDFILNGDSELHGHFTFAERQELAASVAQQQSVRQSELNVENNQRIQDRFLGVRSLTDARRLLQTVKNSNNGVTDGQLPGTFLNSGTQMQWVNALENMITRMEIEALPPPPEEIVLPAPPEPPDLLSPLQVGIVSQQLTREQATAEANRLVSLTPEQGGISASEHRTIISMIDSRAIAPNVDQAIRRIDRDFPPDRDRTRLQNVRIRDQFNNAMRSIMQETGLGIQGVTSLTNEQVDKILDNIIQEEQNRSINLRVSTGDVRQSFLGANNTLISRTQPVEQFMVHVENGRFLGLENNPEYRNRALLLMQEGAAMLQEKLSNPNTGHRQDGNYVFGQLAPAGTQITQMELGRGLIPQYFVPSPYSNEFTVEMNGQTGFIVSMRNGSRSDLEYVIYNPSRQTQGGNSMSDFTSLTDPHVRTIMQQGVNNYRIQQFNRQSQGNGFNLQDVIR